MFFSKRIVVPRRIFSERYFHTTQVRKIDPKTVEEIKIPVPWGHIAGKWWGNKKIEPVIAVHGWQDNAGSWDPVAELMPEDFSILAIDVPGNGRSSHLPPLQSYYFNDAIAVIRRIKYRFGWDKLHIMGHSGGSAICFLYSCVFPQSVKSYLGIDYLSSCYNDEKKRADEMGRSIDKNIKYALREHSSSRRYTWEEAKKIWIQATKSSLNDKSAEILMKRGVNKTPDGKYIFSRDHRLKTEDINIFNIEQISRLAENIKCHIRLVRGRQSDYFHRGIKHCPNILNIIRNKAETYQFHEMDGKHHLHMDTPEKIVPILVELLSQKT